MELSEHEASSGALVLGLGVAGADSDQVVQNLFERHAALLVVAAASVTDAGGVSLERRLAASGVRGRRPGRSLG